MKSFMGDDASDDSYSTEDSFLSADEGDSSPDSSPTRASKTTAAAGLRSALASANCNVDPNEKKAKLNMKFSTTVHICLVLSRTEMKPLMNDLFWKAEEYVRFKHDAVNELRAHLTARGITAKEAIFELYQPHDHERKQWLAEYTSSLRNKSCTDEDTSGTSSQDSGDDEYLQDIRGKYYFGADQSTNGEDNLGEKNPMTQASNVTKNSNTGVIDSSLFLKTPTRPPTSPPKSHGWALAWRPKPKLSQ